MASHWWLVSNSIASQHFPWRWAARTTYISSKLIVSNYRFYSNIFQILLLYNTRAYYNKFESMDSLGVYYCCVKIPQCGYMEHGLTSITFYVQKHIPPLVMCYNPPLVRDKPLGAPAFVNLVHWTLRRKSQRSSNQNDKIFCQQNASENIVCKNDNCVVQALIC